MSKYRIESPWDFIIVRQLDKYMMGHKGYIAGGCFKNIFNKEKFKDVDIFFENKEDYEEAVQLYKNDDDYVEYYDNKKVQAFRNTNTNVVVELIKHKFLSPEKMLDDFDFTITKFVYYKETIYNNQDEDEGWVDYDAPEEEIRYQVMYHEDFFTHLHLKRLVIDKESEDILLPINTYNRAFRYGRYGYFPCRQTKLKMIESIRKVSGNSEELLVLGLYDGLD